MGKVRFALLGERRGNTGWPPVADRHELGIPAKALLDQSRTRRVAENHHLRARRNFLEPFSDSHNWTYPQHTPRKKFGRGPALH